MNFFGIINSAMFFLLDQLHTLVHSYGLAIILLTVAIRLLLWPLNSSQTRSMRKMQELQPKIKSLQDKYKDNPAKMQEEMMKFYSENSFNPMAGCLPLLVQLPIFIGLYGALSSPAFLAQAGNEHFLFLKNLSHSLQTPPGRSFDGIYTIAKGTMSNAFTADTTVTLHMANGKTLPQEVADIHKLVMIHPQKIIDPSEPFTMTLDFKSLGLTPDYNTQVKAADALLMYNSSRELERIHFENQGGQLQAVVKAVPADTTPFPLSLVQNASRNWDVLLLILVYAVISLGYQRMMTGRQPKPVAGANDPAAAMQNNPAMKMMPVMFLVMFFFIPIPAGALIYLVVTTLFMLIQTWMVNAEEDKKAEAKQKPSKAVVDVKAD